MNAQEAKALRTSPLATPTDLKPNAVRDLAGALNILLADMFGLYVKTLACLGAAFPRLPPVVG
jgi:starvation-inducible DNA-binding protein